ncbi:MAG: hypothetical protein M3Y06_07095, partial [Actinomycetota bacterium]|nr:hypothetical protein [Actinomycetota bacterium]
RLHRDPEIPPGIHPGLAATLTAMTAREPTHRPTAARVHEALTDGAYERLPYADTQIVEQHFESDTSVLPLAAVPTERSGLRLVLAGVAAAVVGVSGLAVLLANTGESPSLRPATSSSPSETPAAGPLSPSAVRPTATDSPRTTAGKTTPAATSPASVEPVVTRTAATTQVPVRPVTPPRNAKQKTHGNGHGKGHGQAP